MHPAETANAAQIWDWLGIVTVVTVTQLRAPGVLVPIISIDGGEERHQMSLLCLSPLKRLCNSIVEV